YISAAGIVLWNIRRIQRERIAYIGVLMAVVAVVLPYARHRDLVKSAGAEAFLVKRLLQVINALIITEFPVSVQQYKTIGSLPFLTDRIHGNRRRDIVRTVRHRVQVKYAEIFIVSWYQHVCVPLFLLFFRCFSFLFRRKKKLQNYFQPYIRNYIENVRKFP